MTQVSRRSALLILGGVGAAAAAGGVLWVTRDDAATEFEAPQAARSRTWRAGISSDHFTPPVFFDGTLYCYDPHGVAYALDARTGTPRWKVATKLQAALAGPIVVGDRLIVGGATGPVADDTTGALVALDRGTGSEVWRHKLSVLPVVTPIPGTGLLGIGDQSGLVAALGADDGREAWRLPAQVSGTVPFGGTVRLEASDERLYAVYEYSTQGSRTQMLTALDAHGAVVWSVDRTWIPRTDRRADSGGEPQLFTWLKPGDDGLLHVLCSPTSTNGIGIDDPSTSEELVTCRADSGEVVWRLETHRIDAPPMLVGGVLYLRVKRSEQAPAEIRAIDARTGAVHWSYTAVGRVVPMLQRSDQTTIAVGRDAVCAGGNSGFVALDRKSGKALWSTARPRGDFMQGPVTWNDAVFVNEGSGEDSVIHAWHLTDGTPLPDQEGLSIGVHLLVAEDLLIAATWTAIHAYPLPLT